MKTQTTCLAKAPVKLAALFIFSFFPILLSAADTDATRVEKKPPTATEPKEAVASKTSHIENDGNHVTVARGRFTDKSKPGTLKIEGVPFAKLKIKGTSSDEIIIVSEMEQKGRDRVDAEGFRRLDEFGTFDLVEKDNVAMIKTSQMYNTVVPEFKLFLPRDTNLDIQDWGRVPLSSIEIENIRGDLVLQGSPDKIELDNLGGAILIDVVGSKVSAEFETTPIKPISISIRSNLSRTVPSISNERKSKIDLELPSDAKADLFLQTLSGKIRTNFSEEKLILEELDSKTVADSKSRTSSAPRPLYQKTGKLNGGGVKIHLTTDLGPITIKETD